MKMFSGDKKGLVSCTEVDFYAVSLKLRWKIEYLFFFM
jgi:hypothetical protein